MNLSGTLFNLSQAGCCVVCMLLTGCLLGRELEQFPPDLQNVEPGRWVPLYNGRTLAGWTPVTGASYGEIYAEPGMIVLEEGGAMTALAWAGKFPRENYQVELEAARISGGDFFCGMTFPVGDSSLTLIVGGFGGEVLGLSNVDSLSAPNNRNLRQIKFDNERWYHIRLSVTRNSIDMWLNGEHMISQARAGHLFSIWPTQRVLLPFGVSTWYTRASLREIRFRRVEG